eukprot:1699347-Rhodomonas_salina.1
MRVGARLELLEMAVVFALCVGCAVWCCFPFSSHIREKRARLPLSCCRKCLSNGAVGFSDGEEAGGEEDDTDLPDLDIYEVVPLCPETRRLDRRSLISRICCAVGKNRLKRECRLDWVAAYKHPD